VAAVEVASEIPQEKRRFLSSEMLDGPVAITDAKAAEQFNGDCLVHNIL
jgi:hypothetical protein